MKPRPFFRALLPLALAIVPASCTPEPTLVQGTAVDQGKALFNDPTIAGTTLNVYSCATCHTTGTTDPAGKILAGAPLEGVTMRPSYWGGQELELLRSINDCLYYFMLKDRPWEADDTQAEAMYAYLDSISQSGKGTEAVAFTVKVKVEDMPAGDATLGKAVYDQTCHLCHGAAHTGAGKLVQRASILPDQTVAGHPSPTYSATDRRLVFIEKTRHGAFLGYGGEMPPFSMDKLSDEQLGDLLAFFGLY